MMPYRAPRGQKIAANGTVSTYALVYTTDTLARGGVLDLDGNIHMVPYAAGRGQKIDVNGTVSTYSITGLTEGGQQYDGGVTLPNGEIHFINNARAYGMKISPNGIVNTYPLPYLVTGQFSGGVLDEFGNVHMIPYNATTSVILWNNSIAKISRAWAMHPFWNKY
jgi:hypothetical protein